MATRRWRGDDHSSRPGIAGGLKRPTRRLRTGRPQAPPYLALLRAGFCLPSASRRTRCALTAPFHPYPPLRCRVGGRYVFCATFLRVTPTGRYPAHCPLEFGLSSRLQPPCGRDAAKAPRSSHAVRRPAVAQLHCCGTQRLYPVLGVNPLRSLPASRPSAVELLFDVVLLELLVEVAAGRVDHIGSP